MTTTLYLTTEPSEKALAVEQCLDCSALVPVFSFLNHRDWHNSRNDDDALIDTIVEEVSARFEPSFSNSDFDALSDDVADLKTLVENHLANHAELK